VPVAVTRGVDHAGAVGGGAESSQQQVRQQERREVVDLEGHLVTVGADGARGEDGARVIGQDVDPLVASQQVRREPAHVRKPTVVRQVRPAAYPPRHRRGLVWRPPHHRHGGSELGEPPGRCRADPGTRAGDHDGLAAQPL